MFEPVKDLSFYVLDEPVPTEIFDEGSTRIVKARVIQLLRFNHPAHAVLRQLCDGQINNIKGSRLTVQIASYLQSLGLIDEQWAVPPKVKQILYATQNDYEPRNGYRL